MKKKVLYYVKLWVDLEAIKEEQYKDCLFTLLKIPSLKNNCDNTLLVVVKSEK